MIKERKWGEGSSFGPRQWFRQKLLAKELKRNLSKGLVLDAGCGEGGMSLWLAKNGYEVFSFDEAKAGLKRFLEKATEINCWLGKLEKIALKDESMDIVIAGDVLEHIEDDQNAVREFYRVLKPKGLVIVSAPEAPEKWSIDDEWSGHKRRYTKEGLERLFNAVGFKNIKCFYWGGPMIWLYYRLFYLPWLKRKLKKGNNKTIKGMKRLRGVEWIFWIIFGLDWLFLGIPFGVGLIGVFEKGEN